MSEDLLSRTPTRADARVTYGPSPQNFVDLRYPQGRGPFPILIVIHGGFWKSLYDLAHMSHLCTAVTAEDVITCNLEYRRIGDEGGGWPGTFQDVSLGADMVSEVASGDDRFDRERLAVLGFSAGGHLALWLSSAQRVKNKILPAPKRSGMVYNALSVAGVTDLRAALKRGVGGSAVENLMGGSPDGYPERYDAASPIELLPTGAKQTLIHGTADDIVPIWQSEDYERRARDAGDEPLLVRLEGTGHFDTVDPESAAWPDVLATIKRVLAAG